MEQQRSKEWFDKRVGRVTGSSVGSILRLSPFGGPDEVMRRMVRQANGIFDDFGNVATEYGTKFEPFACGDFEMETGLDVVETGFHTFDDWLGASPDGLVGDDALIEIKCPYGRRDSDEFKSIFDQPHYYAQIQIQLYVTERQKCYFYQWSNQGSRIEIVMRNDSWLAEKLPKLKAFHERYLSEIESPDKHLVDLIQTKEADQLAEDYRVAKAVLDEATKDVKRLRQELIDLADGNKSNISGLLVYPINKQGSISYAKIVKEKLPDLDLDEYRGKPSTSWGVK